ncbi:G protein-coupled receptor-6 [Proboscivirus elephantidbeta4]|uniref:G protein-coupled receptor-6 n=1 Tax=Elephant endotheliotropic herpesvirus 4 TaxID=548914 RepID=A0A0S1TQD2_9BETA|nr:G protein-coupled receptor-6 [Elephant endotheliotropic herpesvirus 4]ALM25925.1 G protein-coupled receptor-6 [Elephant endotheliotropic herpesvirus 4]
MTDYRVLVLAAVLLISMPLTESLDNAYEAYGAITVPVLFFSLLGLLLTCTLIFALILLYFNRTAAPRQLFPHNSWHVHFCLLLAMSFLFTLTPLYHWDSARLLDVGPIPLTLCYASMLVLSLNLYVLSTYRQALHPTLLLTLTVFLTCTVAALLSKPRGFPYHDATAPLRLVAAATDRPGHDPGALPPPPPPQQYVSLTVVKYGPPNMYAYVYYLINAAAILSLGTVNFSPYARYLFATNLSTSVLWTVNWLTFGPLPSVQLLLLDSYVIIFLYLLPQVLQTYRDGSLGRRSPIGGGGGGGTDKAQPGLESVAAV